MLRALVIAAAGCTHALATPLANTAATFRLDQQLKPLVLDFFATCVLPHRVEVSIDARHVATVTITCPPPPRPAPGKQLVVIVVSDGPPPSFDGPPIEIAPGRHTIAARDALTGRSAVITAEFPATKADTILIADDERGIMIGVKQRSLLIVL